MRHVRFGLLALVALVTAVPSALPWVMNECQLNRDPVDIAACFRNAERGRLVWEATILATIVLAVGLHLARSKWALLGLFSVALVPWLMMFV